MWDVVRFARQILGSNLVVSPHPPRIKIDILFLSYYSMGVLRMQDDFRAANNIDELLCHGANHMAPILEGPPQPPRLAVKYLVWTPERSPYARKAV